MTLKSNLFQSILIFIICFITQWTINQKNISNLNNSGIETRLNQTVITADDYSYLNPVENFLKTGIWKESKTGDNAFYQRSPGYGLFSLPFLNFESESKGLFYLKLTQNILQSAIPVLIFYFLLYISFSKKLALIAAILFGISPNLNGFIFYTLTEGITPILVTLFFVLSYKSYHDNNKKTVLLASVTLGFLILTRPVFAILSLLLLPSFIQMRLKGITTILGSILITISPISIWQIRNYKLSNELTNLHPIYSPSNNSVFRLPHQSIFNLVKQFNPNGANYHEWINKLKVASNNNLEYQKIKNPLSIFNESSLNLFTEDTLNKYTKLYFQSFKEITQNSNEKKYSETEKLITNKFEILKEDYISEHWFESNLFTPFKVFKDLVFHSNLNLYQFQHTYRGNWFMEGLRYINYIIHVTIFILPILIFLLFRKKIGRKVIWIIPAILYLFYLCYFQRGIEERYTYPILGYLYLINFLFFKKISIK